MKNSKIKPPKNRNIRDFEATNHRTHVRDVWDVHELTGTVKFNRVVQWHPYATSLSFALILKKFTCPAFTLLLATMSDTDLKNPPPPRSRRWLPLTVGAFAALALILGLGLGLGLKHRHKNQSTGSSSPATSLPNLQPQPTSNAMLEGLALASQTPTQRVYNFTISEVKGAPDGVERTMMVVNGINTAFFFWHKFLNISYYWQGCILDQQSRRIKGIYLSSTFKTIFQMQLAFIGTAWCVYMSNISPVTDLALKFQNGTNFFDGTSGVTECGIPPGQSFTYKWGSQSWSTSIVNDSYSFTFGGFSGTTWWQWVLSSVL